MKQKIIQLISVHRYHEYLVDLMFSKVVLNYWKFFRDFKIGEKEIIRGLPIISIVNKSTILIGSHAYIISRSRNTALGVNHPTILRTLKPAAIIDIGDHFRASGVSICAAQNITIGNRVTLGSNVIVVDTDFHSSNPVVRFSKNDNFNAKNATVKIEDDVFIGMNAMILKGATIGKAAIIGAGAVVTKDVPDGAIAFGNPLRLG